MSKLTPRYSPEEMSRLKELLKPVERWSVHDHRQWARVQFGFRHFRDPKIVCIEHFWPKPLTPAIFAAAGGISTFREGGGRAERPLVQKP